MTFTYDPALSSDRDRIRLLIPDRIAAEAIFQDEEIAGLLALEGSVKGAVALALEMIAADEALVQKVLQTQEGLRTDGAKTAAVLLERAKALREELAAGTRRRPVPVTGKLAAIAPVTPSLPPDANDPAYTGSPYARARGA